MESFKRIKDELIIELSAFNENFKITEDFKKKFFKLIEICTFSMMKDEENFFALFLIQMKREISMDLPSPTGTKLTSNGFIIYFNPIYILECTIKEIQALIKHEIYHIMSGHHIRAKALKYKYSNLAINIAMDISINQYILNLPSWSYSIDNVKRSYNVVLEEDKTMEQYADIIQKALNKLKKEKSNEEDTEDIDWKNSHELWSLNDEVDESLAKEMTKKLASSALKGRVPKSIDELMRELNKKSEISWKDYLKKLLGSLPHGYKKTITRKDRRQPERLDLRGRLPKYTAQIAVAIDISGSISDKEIEEIMAEVFSIVKNYHREITILECDSNVRRVYKVKNIKDIKKKLNTRGSTKFSPVFEYMKNNNMNNYILIYFTDGLGEKELSIRPVHKKTLWVLTGKEQELSLKNPYGVIKKLSNNKIKEQVIENAPELIKEFRELEWQQSG